MRNYIIADEGYIVATAETPFGHDENAETVERILCRQPAAPEGYVYRLRADTLEWELCETAEA